MAEARRYAGGLPVGDRFAQDFDGVHSIGGKNFTWLLLVLALIPGARNGASTLCNSNRGLVCATKMASVIRCCPPMGIGTALGWARKEELTGHRGQRILPPGRYPSAMRDAGRPRPGDASAGCPEKEDVWFSPWRDWLPGSFPHALYPRQNSTVCCVRKQKNKQNSPVVSRDHQLTAGLLFSMSVATNGATRPCRGGHLQRMFIRLSVSAPPGLALVSAR